jgi:hypothetical protein
LPKTVFTDCDRKNTTCVIDYTHNTDTGVWEADTHTVADASICTLVTSHLSQEDTDSIFVAWNMKAHDRHVLRRAAGKDLVDSLALWDPLPWFRSRYGLPKNTLSSNRPGTPRAVFAVKVHGLAHSSFADAAHMRDVVMRAAYCYARAEGDTNAWQEAKMEEVHETVRNEIEEDMSERDIVSVWTKIPDSVKKAV